MALRFDVPTDKYQLTLLRGQIVDYEAPRRFFLPRTLRKHQLSGYEPLTMAAFLACADRSTGTIFDIGANIGVYAMVAASIGKFVVAFEPNVDAARILEDIKERYSLPIRVRNIAVSDCIGTGTLFLSAMSDMSNSLNPSFRAHSGVAEVEISTIDEESKYIDIGVIKIDTESTEMQVLRGATAAIRNWRPYLFVELLDTTIAQHARDLLSEFDYEMYSLGDLNTWGRFGVSEIVSGDSRNWIASPTKLDEGFFEQAMTWLERLRRLEKAS